MTRYISRTLLNLSKAAYLRTAVLNLSPFSAVIFSLAVFSSVTLCLTAAEAKKAPANTPTNNQNAFQEQIDKSNKQAPATDIYQTDYSKNFSYVLPTGWQVTQNPMYPHDILVKQKSEGKGNIVIADQPAKGGLGKMGNDMVDELPKQCDEFKLVSNEMVKLSSGVNCARLMHTGKLGESEICQVNYLMPYTRGRILIVTGTVIKGDTDSLATVERFASSVIMKKKKLSL